MMPNTRPIYRRIQAPIFHRPTSWFTQGLRRQKDLPALGCVRSYSDDSIRPGRLLEMGVFLPDGEELTAVVEVEWCDPLPHAEPARFDVGMRILRMEPAARRRLEDVLARA